MLLLLILPWTVAHPLLGLLLLLILLCYVVTVLFLLVRYFAHSSLGTLLMPILTDARPLLVLTSISLHEKEIYIQL